MKRAAAAASLALPALLLTACAATPPALDDQTGNPYADARQAAVDAGYHDVQARVPDDKNTVLGFLLTEGPQGLPEEYRTWTVCKTRAIDATASEPGWTVSFALVEHPDHCKNRKLDPAMYDHYETLAAKAQAAANTKAAEMAAPVPTRPAPDPSSRPTPPPSFPGTRASEDPPLALDLAWLTMSVSDRAYMCGRYRQEPDHIARLLVSMIKEQSISTAQAHTLFRTNC